MKKTVLCLLGTCTILAAGLTSCSTDNNVKLSAQESRNLRLASGIGLINSEVGTIKKAPVMDDAFNAKLTLALPSLDIVVENNFKVDATVEGEGEEKKFDYNGATYSFRETISYVDANEQTKSIVMYYNYVNELNDDKQFTENIEGVVAVNEVAHVNFKSTAFTEKGYDKRNLSLYLGPDASFASLDIAEETKLDGDKSTHQFTYRFKLAGSEVISYSISLDRLNTTMSVKVLSVTFDLTRRTESNKVEYVATVKGGVTGIESSLTFVKEVKDGEVSYTLSADASINKEEK